MEYTIPHYFDRFRCVAAECEDTCCAGWAIMIDEDSLEKYKNYPEPFGKRLRNSIDWKKGSFCQYEGRCAFLNRDNLCDLHLEAGEQMLCDTCRDYPRHMEEFEGVREGSLSLSCIEAAKIILGCEEPVQFIHFEDDVEDEEYEDFDYLLYTKLVDARTVIIKVLQNRELDISVRVSMVLQLAKEIQDAVEQQEMFRIDEAIEKITADDVTLDYKREQMDLCATMRKMFRVFQKLEVLNADWPEYVKKTEIALFREGRMAYLENRRAFNKRKDTKFDVWVEQLMVYFVFTYFCGAVYDNAVLAKMQTAIVTTILIQELVMARWIESGEIDFETFVDTAHRVSREIEHSDINLIRLEKMFEKTDVFQVEELLQILMYEKKVE